MKHVMNGGKELFGRVGLFQHGANSGPFSPLRFNPASARHDDLDIRIYGAHRESFTRRFPGAQRKDDANTRAFELRNYQWLCSEENR